MYVRRIYLGYNSNMRFHLLQIKPYWDVLNKLTNDLSLKIMSLKSLNEVYNNLNIIQSPFYMDKSSNNNYIYRLIVNLYRAICNRTKIPTLTQPRDISNLNPKYVIYVGYKTNSSNKHLKMLAIFPFNSQFILHKKNLFGLTINNKIPVFDTVPNNTIVQLPISKNEDIVNIYVTNKNFKIKVYKPLIFDDVFETNVIKCRYAKEVINKLVTSDITLTVNNVRVKFIHSKIKDIMHKIFNNEQLLEYMSTFTGSKRNAIQQISNTRLKKILVNLKSRIKYSKQYNLEPNNVPLMSSNLSNLYVTLNSLPIFCSLLTNNVIDRVLTKDIYIPYYSK